MNYYKRHVGDCLKDASHLTLTEHGAYVRLEDLYYTREAALPADENQVARLLAVRNDAERAVVLSVLREFWQLTDTGWTQRRCEEQLQAYIEKAEANRENGNKGGRPKGSGKPTTNPDGSRKKPKQKREKTMVADENNPFPVASSHKPITSKPPEYYVPETSEIQTEPINNPHGFERKPVGNAPEFERDGTDAPRARANPAAIETDDAHEMWMKHCQRPYPAGMYGAEQFLIGEKRARQRILEGFMWSDLGAAVQAMAAQKRAQGKIGTEFVWSPANFFGGDPQLPGRFIFQREFKLPQLSEKPDARAAQELGDLQKLKDRRGAIGGLTGFRDPIAGETADQYRQAQKEVLDALERQCAKPRFSAGLSVTETGHESPSPEQFESRPGDLAAQVGRLVAQAQAGSR